MNDLYRVLFQAMLSFFVLFLLSKILGKKQVAQLEFMDYVVGISIGSIAAQMAIEPQIPWFHFVIAMTVYAFFDLGITLISRKSKLLKKLFKGKPLIVISQGKINFSNLKKANLMLTSLFHNAVLKDFLIWMKLIMQFLSQVEIFPFCLRAKT